ncbi:MAG: hypothetical protein HOC23_09685 [Halieaceae bacterium]|nr:hypothetical protein [Halieaceae bacterium]
MIHRLQEARDAIDDPALFPAPATERNLAEGYRYLLGFMLGNIERALDDPMYPRFKRAIQPMNRSTIDNSDAVYLCAEIDGNYSYVIKGRAANSRHWRGEPAVAGLRAPQYVIFELGSGYAGDSGSLMELIPGTRIGTDSLDCHSLQVEPDGSFEILVAPQRPENHEGNFMLSKRTSHDKEHVGQFLVCRELFHDWENEDLLDLEILRVGCEKEALKPLTPDAAVTMMKKAGELTNNHMRFWNQFYTVLLETYGKTEMGLSGEGEKSFMPTNDMNAPNAMGIATGGGQSTNIYAGGVFKLEDEEALIIESSVPVPPSFLGFHLSNLWGESLDFESYQSSLNASQMEVGEDGIYRWVVSHRDPDLQNWLDTTGLDHGFLTVRYTYGVAPPKEDWPTLNVRKVQFDDIGKTLNSPYRKVERAERQENTLVRHRHVQRRYRQY